MSTTVVKSTPLSLALDAGYGDVAQALLERGADRNIHTEVKRNFKSTGRP